MIVLTMPLGSRKTLLPSQINHTSKSSTLSTDKQLRREWRKLMQKLNKLGKFLRQPTKKGLNLPMTCWSKCQNSDNWTHLRQGKQRLSWRKIRNSKSWTIKMHMKLISISKRRDNWRISTHLHQMINKRCSTEPSTNNKSTDPHHQTHSRQLLAPICHIKTIPSHSHPNHWLPIRPLNIKLKLQLHQYK